MAKQKLTFEASMQRLELAACNEMLDTAEQKVVQLKKGSDGAPVELPFEAEE